MTANVPSGYRFANWTGTGGFVTTTANPVTVTGVTQNMTITANYIKQYTVTFQTDGTPGATLTGSASQTVDTGGSCTAVTANVPSGYRFANWTGTGGFVTTTANPVTVTGVTQSMTITANYIKQYTVTFQTDGTPGATLTGSASQTVDTGGSCTAVTANVPSGYRFANWTGTGGFVTTTANPVTVTGVTQSMTITANYIKQYTVTFQTDGTPGATLTGSASQTVDTGGSCTAVTANVPSGYRFANWTGTGGFVTTTANPVTVTGVTQNMTITANYIKQYTVTFQTDGTPGATLTGSASQTVDTGGSCTAVTANVPSGYRFANWTGTGGFVTTTANPVTVTGVTQSMTITANYIKQYTVTFQTDGTPGATLTGSASQTVDTGGSCTAVTANVPSGYRFANWTGTGGFVTTTANPVTVTGVTQSMTITANYIKQYTVTFQTDGTPGATLTGSASQTVDTGGSCTAVTANVPSGYRFANWTGTGGFVTTTANPLTVTGVTQSMTITANYIKQYTVTFQTDGTPGATLTGSASQTVDTGGSCTAVTANVPSGYRFANWTGTGGFVTTTANPLTVTGVTQSMTITANYIKQYTVTFQTDGTPGATLTGSASQTVDTGGSCTAVTANVPSGYRFANWTGTGGFVTTTANPVTVTGVTQSMTITANYIKQYTVTFQTDGTPGATLTGSASQTVDTGGSCTAVTANAPAHYHFVNWTGTGGFVTTTANPLTVTGVTQNMTITANFAITTHTVNFVTDGTAGASLTGATTQTVSDGSNSTAVTAVPPAHYHFVNWTGTGGFVTTTTNPVTVTNVTQDMTITASFAITQHVVNFQTDGTVGASITGSTSQPVSDGADCTPVSANAPQGYSFINWTGTGGFSSTDNPLTVKNVTQDMTITANFYQGTITPPKTLTGPKTGMTGAAYNYTAGGSVVTPKAPVEYQFDSVGGNHDPADFSGWGSATQPMRWTTANTYNVYARARSKNYPALISDWSGPLAVSVAQKPFIHVTSPNGGETWVVGTTHTITWDSNYLGNGADPGTVYLYYSYAGAWHPITDSLTNPSAITCLGTSCSYSWVIPPMPATGTPTPGSPVPKNHMASTSVYIGNWATVNGTPAWQCWDTSDKNFYILDNGWAFTISGADRGGAVLFFNADGSTFDGYGISLNKGMFRIPQDPQNQDEGLGTYTVAANGKINGTYQLADQLSDFSDNPSPDGSGSITGTLNANAKTMALTLKNQSTPPVTVFTMSGVWLSDLTMPENWSVQISGSAKGAISPGNPLKIETYTDLNDQPYADVFDINGSGTLPDGITPISITGDFFFTPAKSVYGFYELNINGSIEDGILSGTLNLSTGKFTFSLTTTSTNGKGHKYTFAGLKVATP